MPDRPPLLATRRTALATALIGVGATGCRLDRPSGRAGADSSTTRQTASAASATAERAPDAALVDEVLAELTRLSRLTASVARHEPSLREPARSLEELHRAHREALGDEVPAATPADGPRPPDAAAALRLLRRRELRAQRLLVDWAVAAESGSLARLLASMAAGVAQHVATLPERPSARRAGR